MTVRTVLPQGTTAVAVPATLTLLNSTGLTMICAVSQCVITHVQPSERDAFGTTLMEVVSAMTACKILLKSRAAS